MRTDPGAHLGWFVADELRRLGGQWLLLGDDGIDYDADSRLPVEAPPGSRAASLPLAAETVRSCPALTFDVQTREPALGSTICGRVAQHMVAGLGGGRLSSVGVVEPFEHRWSTRDLTMRLRAEMPLSRRHLASTPSGALATVQVEHAEHGLAEHSRGIVPAPQGSALASELIRMVTTVLTDAAAQFHVASASMKLTTVEKLDGRLGHQARPRPADLPVAVLLGPTLVRDLGVEPGVLRQEFQASTIDVTSGTALIVVFAGAPDPQGQYRKFLSRIGGEVLQRFRGDSGPESPAGRS